MRKRCKRRFHVANGLKLAAQPWKVQSVFAPIERVLHRMQADGVIDCAQGRPVFHEDGRGGWYEVVAALRGVIQFHQLAEARHGIEAEVDGMVRLANKLDLAAPIFEEDIATVYADIESCKRQALRLTIDEATDIVKTIQISAAFDQIKLAPTASPERSLQAAGKQPRASTQHQEAA
ncbi:hypothetical protein GBK02_09045 [Dechloromonas sp. TW-R-39-2]|uniref:hypothetical protein n=1 Tax=Dechloromonas sp. TW-R-39-2 TaxID=2654218 RepID=UPI00193C8AD6|nr:hypothetical protein [Dechloromonas sp. TW-R-39-2]QRM19536.1 hypothetical protein GBK02_09045 [Dechloromonas sp. TW-R-39-2]